jgi:hypothetical protein
VGSSSAYSGEHAFIWTKQAGIKDLNSADSGGLDFTFIEAHAINAHGQVLVVGRSAHGSVMSNMTSSEDNQICAPAPPSNFLLTPVTPR